MNLVIACTQGEFETWLRRNGRNPSMYSYVASRDHMRGIQPRKVFLLGRYWQRNDWKALEEDLKMRFAYQYFETVEEWI